MVFVLVFFFVYLFLISIFYFCQVQNQCNKMPPDHCTQANVMMLSDFIFKDYGPLILIACISVIIENVLFVTFI